jgi:hypothetical protein
MIERIVRQDKKRWYPWDPPEGPHALPVPWWLNPDERTGCESKDNLS